MRLQKEPQMKANSQSTSTRHLAWVAPCAVMMAAWAVTTEGQPRPPAQEPPQQQPPVQPLEPRATQPPAQGLRGIAQPSPDAVPIRQLLESVSSRTGDVFIVDPRVHTDVTLIGIQPDDVDYATLLSVLAVHSLVAVRSGSHVLVLPDSVARTLPTPVVDDAASRPSHEHVVSVITLRSVPATQLVPVLRPMMPQFAHLAPTECPNALIVSDIASNVAKIEALVSKLDMGEALAAVDCDAGAAAAPARRRPGGAPTGN